jgi:tetratricopeptide (TPR) repeat protein
VPLFEEAVAGLKVSGGPNSRNTVYEMQALGQAYAKAGRLADSEQILEEVVHLYRTKPIAQYDDAPTAMAQLGQTLIREGKYDEAESILRESRTNSAIQLSPWLSAFAQSLLGEVLVHQKKYAEAEPLLSQGYRGLKDNQNAIPGDQVRTLTEAAQRLVALYTDWGKPELVAQWSATVESQRKEKAATTTTRSVISQ